MNTRINELIIRQLGELPEEIKTAMDAEAMLLTLNPMLYSRLPPIDEETEMDTATHEVMKFILEQEVEKRELLALLIESTSKERQRIIAVSNPMIRNFDAYFYSTEKKYIECIEKSLNMKWSDIVDFIEGDNNE